MFLLQQLQFIAISGQIYFMDGLLNLLKVLKSVDARSSLQTLTIRTEKNIF